MADGEGVGVPPIPDPTILTTEQLLRVARSERDYVDGKIEVLIERFRAIDKATELLSDTVNKVPTEVQREVGNLNNVMVEKFESVDKQFKERDTRSEREARDNKLAVDAAFAAQEKQAVAESVSNQKAIDKSEVATNKAIDKLAELFESRVGGLAESLSDLKLRVQAMESAKQGVVENAQQNYQAQEPATAKQALANDRVIAFTAAAAVVISVLAAAGVF